MSVHALMFGWEYPPLHSGGLGVACQGLVRGLLENGVRVTLVLPSAAANADPDVAIRTPEECSQCTVIRVPADLRPYESGPDYLRRTGGVTGGGMADLYGPNLGEAVARFEAVSVELTRDLKPDVVHCHDWMTYGAGMRAAAYHGVPLVTHIHATEFDRTNFHPDPWIASIEKRGLLAADRVIAVSRYTKDLLVKQYGVPAGKIAVIHNGHAAPRAESNARITSLHSGKRAPLVLFLGRLTIQKNPRIFLDVAHRIHGIRPDVRFVMAGDGPMLPELIDRACELGLQEAMIFTGKVGRRDVPELYRQADCFIMPSLSEPFGLVALEAVGHGVPVVLSKQSGASEVIDHAFKVDFWDSEKMADCILTILREQPLAQQLSSEAPRILRTLTWENQARTVRSLYESLRPS